MELPWETSSTSPPKKKLRESQLWKNFKKAVATHKPAWKLTRIETWAMPGIPDVLICDEEGNLLLVELKVASAFSVNLSPHQISFLTSHSKAPVWLLVGRDEELFLYRGSAAVEVGVKGLKVKPYCQSRTWEKVLPLLSAH